MLKLVIRDLGRLVHGHILQVFLETKTSIYFVKACKADELEHMLVDELGDAMYQLPQRWIHKRGVHPDLVEIDYIARHPDVHWSQGRPSHHR